MIRYHFKNKKGAFSSKVNSKKLIILLILVSLDISKYLSYLIPCYYLFVQWCSLSTLSNSCPYSSKNFPLYRCFCSTWGCSWLSVSCSRRQPRIWRTGTGGCAWSSSPSYLDSFSCSLFLELSWRDYSKLTMTTTLVLTLTQPMKTRSCIAEIRYLRKQSRSAAWVRFGWSTKSCSSHSC